MRRGRLVAVAVRPMDSFTGEPVEPGWVRVYMEDGGPGIWKEGYVVFWDNGSSLRSLVLDGPNYGREEILLSIAEIRQQEKPIWTVWMKPSRGYPYPTSVTLREEIAQAHEVIPLPIESSKGGICLGEDYREGQQTILFVCHENWVDMELEGRTLAIRRQAESEWEYMTIGSGRDKKSGAYGLWAPLTKTYEKGDGVICLVLQVKADDRGVYQIPVLDG